MLAFSNLIPLYMLFIRFQILSKLYGLCHVHSFTELLLSERYSFLNRIRCANSPVHCCETLSFLQIPSTRELFSISPPVMHPWSRHCPLLETFLPGSLPKLCTSSVKQHSGGSTDKSDSIFGPLSCPCLLDDLPWRCVFQDPWRLLHIL